MKYLITGIVMFLTVSMYAQTQIHAVNSNGGEIAKLESVQGFPELVFANENGDVARIELKQTTNVNAINDDDLNIVNMKDFGKIRLRVGGGTGAGVVTVNPTNNINGVFAGAYVGINTNSPSAPFTVNTPIGGVTAEFRSGQTQTYLLFTAVDNVLTEKGYMGFFDPDYHDYVMGTPLTNPLGNLEFRTVNQTRLAIDPSGSVYVGDPDDFVGNPVALNVCGDIHASGSVVSNIFLCNSDKRYKSEITTISDARAKVEALEGVTYYWNQEDFPNRGFDENKQIGLIAQDVEAVLPELVFTNEGGYKSVDYASLTAVLVEAIKDQQDKIDNLEAKVDALIGAKEDKNSVASAKE